VSVQLSSQSSGLFQSQILWLVFVVLVEFSQIVFLCLINDGQNTGDRFSDLTALNKKM
jgi:hypothetical protein